MTKKVSLIFLVIMFLCVSACDYEEPNYKILQSQENIEIRQYPSLIIAQIQMAEDKEELRDESFKQLFQYISGKNKEEKEIAMTIPVFVENQNANKKWSMSFIMPQKWDLKQVPMPNNSDIKIKKLDSQKMAVINFSGRGTDEKFSKYTNKLKAYLNKSKIEYDKDTPIYAFYDAPITPWFLKRHEVLFPVLNESTPQ